MLAVTWCSSWSVSTDVDVNVQSLSTSEIALSSLPLHLTSPKDSVPCHLSLLWTPQPLCCTQLQLEVQCSARHIELYAEGTRRNLLGEQEHGEVYLGTFRGTKQSSERQLFAMSPTLKSDRDCNVLECLQTLRIKFVSLMGNKRLLYLQELQCRLFIPTEPVAVVHSSTCELTAKSTTVGPSEGVNAAAPDVLMLLKGLQKTMEKGMETKIARLIDAKISALSQRLALSEQALFHLRKKMDMKDAYVQDSLNQIQQKFLQLEDQLSRVSILKNAEQMKDDGLD